MLTGYHKSQRCVTLLEILCVCACILIVSSLANGSVRKGVDYAIRCTCSSNLRQSAVALNQYADDYHGFYPEFTSAEGLGDLENWKDLYSSSDPEDFFFSTAILMPFGYRKGNSTADPRLPRMLTGYTESVDILCCTGEGPTGMWKDIGPFYYNTTNPFLDPNQKKWKAVAKNNPRKPLAGCQNPDFMFNFNDRGWRHGRFGDSYDGIGNFVYNDNSVKEVYSAQTWPDK